MRLEYYALIANDLEMIPSEQYLEFNGEIVEVKKMLAGFKRMLT